MGSRPICACTCRRSSVIIFCADLERSCVKLKEVSPCTSVAPRTARTIGVSSPTCLWSTTLSTKYFMEPGSTKPETRLMAISTKPSARSPRRGLISAQTSGRFFHAFLRFSVLAGDLNGVSVVMMGSTNYTPLVRFPRRANDHTHILTQSCVTFRKVYAGVRLYKVESDHSYFHAVINNMAVVHRFVGSEIPCQSWFGIGSSPKRNWVCR